MPILLTLPSLLLSHSRIIPTGEVLALNIRRR
jgi:hypothetical protein